MTAPDFIEPFIGWKGLHANEEGLLWSPQQVTLWPAEERFEATCSGGKHEPPHKSCGCGVYAVRSFAELKEEGYNWAEEYTDEKRGRCIAVVAEVSLYGRIFRATRGYRAQYAYPLKVYVPAHKLPLGAKIRRRYGCNLGYIDRFTGERR